MRASKITHVSFMTDDNWPMPGQRVDVFLTAEGDILCATAQATETLRTTGGKLTDFLFANGAEKETRPDIVQFLKAKCGAFRGRIRNTYAPFSAILDFAVEERSMDRDVADGILDRVTEALQNGWDTPADDNDLFDNEEDQPAPPAPLIPALPAPVIPAPAPAPIVPPTPLEEMFRQMQQEMRACMTELKDAAVDAAIKYGSATALKLYLKTPEWTERVGKLAAEEAAKAASQLKDDYDNAKSLHEKRLRELDEEYDNRKLELDQKLEREEQAERQKRARTWEKEAPAQRLKANLLSARLLEEDSHVDEFHIDLTSARSMLKDYLN
jgi:type IV secretory pathway VirB10-like protein